VELDAEAVDLEGVDIAEAEVREVGDEFPLVPARDAAVDEVMGGDRRAVRRAGLTSAG